MSAEAVAMVIAVRLAFAVGWLAAGMALSLGYLDLEIPRWLGAWVAFLMCAYNLLKAWALHRTRRRRDAARGAEHKRYREGQAPPVRRTP
jgi:hypothetical protein